MIFSPQPGKQSVVRETVRGQMTLGDHVANESHSLCVGTLSHARRTLQSYHIGSFSLTSSRFVSNHLFVPGFLPTLFLKFYALLA